jgi:hypothetical protein
MTLWQLPAFVTALTSACALGAVSSSVDSTRKAPIRNAPIARIRLRA